jgi:hypothetical protein
MLLYCRVADALHLPLFVRKVSSSVVSQSGQNAIYRSSTLPLGHRRIQVIHERNQSLVLAIDAGILHTILRFPGEEDLLR